MLSHDIPIRPAARTIQSPSETLSTNPLLGPWASIQREIVQASEDEGWETGIPDFDSQRLEAGIPLLHQCRVTADGKRFVRLLRRLVELAERFGADGTAGVRRALNIRHFDWSPFIRAAINHDGAPFQRYSEDSALLATLTQAATTPLLLACGRYAYELIASTPWHAGFCPVCAAWPLLAEIRGLEQQRWLRCGRCASSWQVDLQRCVYCGNRDFETLGYLAAESSNEARRVVTCEHCRGYLKTVTTFGAQSYADMTRLDLSTVELDIAAVLRDYSRPGDAGYALGVEVALT